ncbi:MAG TPA: C40 family peptidase, partial [Acidimicrobiales bacterium]
VDAIYAAARLLCANGARGSVNISGAIYTYNHDQSYVAKVLSYAAAYGAPEPTSTSQAAATAISYALHQIGTPYLWGGETPGVGFDCSGLTQAAYKAAGMAIPRTSEEQWLALPHVPLDGLQPGDLVFFNPGEDFPGLPGHVGIYLGDNEMVDAPYTGVDVRVDSLGGTEPFGAARPRER